MPANSVLVLKKTNQKNRSSLTWWLVPIVAAFALSACQDPGQGGAQGTPQQKPAVGYVTVRAQSIGLTTELPGRLQAFRSADVRARVPGVLQRRLYDEGSEVKAGEPLFQIDDASYRAALQSAQAQLAQAQASLMQTKSQAERLKPLVAVNAVSKQQYDDAIAAQKTAEANVLAAQAAIQTAKINLGYAAVTAPISGRAGRALVTEGALVGQGDITLLTTIQQIDQLYVNFTQSATDVIKLQQDIKSGAYEVAGDGSIPVTVVLDNGSVYEHQGKLMFTDLTVDATTGQVTLKATLPNPDKLLLPNLYVRVRLEQIQAKGAFLVPQQAVTRGESKDTLYVITPENTVMQKEVTVGGRNGLDWVVTAGLQDGERVMVDGFQKWGMAMQVVIQSAQQHKQETGEDMPMVLEVQPIPWGAEAAAANTLPAEQQQADQQPTAGETAQSTTSGQTAPAAAAPQAN